MTMKKQLFHGTSPASALSILKNGFDFSKCGSNWGSTYGQGIYFTPNYETAKFYAGEDGVVLTFTLNINPYYLTKDISPNQKRKFKLNKQYNTIVNPNKDEYVVFYFI